MHLYFLPVLCSVCVQTPDASQRCSKRAWDGQVRKWRRQLHLWDPKDTLSSATGVGAVGASKRVILTPVQAGGMDAE